MFARDFLGGFTGDTLSVQAGFFLGFLRSLRDSCGIIVLAFLLSGLGALSGLLRDALFLGKPIAATRAGG